MKKGRKKIRRPATAMTSEELVIHRELHLLRVAGAVQRDKLHGRRRRRPKKHNTKQLKTWLGQRERLLDEANG